MGTGSLGSAGQSEHSQRCSRAGRRISERGLPGEYENPRRLASLGQIVRVGFCCRDSPGGTTSSREGEGQGSVNRGAPVHSANHRESIASPNWDRPPT